MKTCDQRSFATFGTRAKASLRDLHISFAVDKPLTIERTSRLEFPTSNQAIFFLPGWIFSVDLAFFKKVARWIVKDVQFNTNRLKLFFPDQVIFCIQLYKDEGWKLMERLHRYWRHQHNWGTHIGSFFQDFLLQRFLPNTKILTLLVLHTSAKPTTTRRNFVQHKKTRENPRIWTKNQRRWEAQCQILKWRRWRLLWQFESFRRVQQ